jgi:hypothetical protein
MMESSYTIDDLHAIERAIASGELTVSYKDRSVTYRSIEELRMAKDDIIKSLTPTNQRRNPIQRAWFDNDIR